MKICEVFFFSLHSSNSLRKKVEILKHTYQNICFKFNFGRNELYSKPTMGCYELQLPPLLQTRGLRI